MVTGPAVPRTCPACGAAVQPDPGYPAWCDACDWNLFAPGAAAARTRRQWRRADAAARHEDAILARALLADIDRELEPLLSRMAAEIRREVYSKLTPRSWRPFPSARPRHAELPRAAARAVQAARGGSW